MHEPSLPFHAAAPARAAASGFDPRPSPLADDRTTTCPHCGTVQRLPRLPGWTTATCSVCRTVIERSTGRSIRAAFACSSAALLLLLPANLLPFLTTSILGVSRQSRLHSSVTAMAGNGWPDLALVIALFVIVLPAARLGLLTLVLGLLQFGHRRPAWLGRAFRWANALEPWSMLDVFVLGLAVAYGKLVSQLSVDVGPGALCLIVVALLGLFLRATLDNGAVWRAIAAPTPCRIPHQPSVPPPLACTVCELATPGQHPGEPCPRCEAPLRHRKPNAIARSTALAIAATLLYFPANIYPMASLPNGLSTDKYTVIGGVIELWQSNLYGLAILVVVASVVIPVLKLAGLAWCIASVLRRSRRHLVAKTHAFAVVEEIGRWSMVDPFIIACFVPVTQFNALVYGRAESAAPAFTAVVVLTVLATRAFDPRLIWDAARSKR